TELRHHILCLFVKFGSRVDERDPRGGVNEYGRHRSAFLKCHTSSGRVGWQDQEYLYRSSSQPKVASAHPIDLPTLWSRHHHPLRRQLPARGLRHHRAKKEVLRAEARRFHRSL